MFRVWILSSIEDGIKLRKPGKIYTALNTGSEGGGGGGHKVA